jgi:hypothetical protein
MPAVPSGIFTEGFLIAIKAMVGVHHSIYPSVPPQGIYFEALVERAFKRTKTPVTIIEAGVEGISLAMIYSLKIIESH